ncbi:MAG TPA: NAD-dependent epimerase/dehydratase family protein [Bryobacteraceae bacterium]|nr:NAD-dependent epimerase/dehydratase family protein [Bryobacteraceae bacterium]
MKNALVTGGAGFIGSHLVSRLLASGYRVTVLDNFDPFYAEAIKLHNIQDHLANPMYTLVRADIRSADELRFKLRDSYDVIVHLAAKAGVRPSIEHPLLYQETNVAGTQNLLEFAKERKILKFVFASSSSVYGVNPRVPWQESDPVLLPISPYASTKVSGELLGHTYSYLYGIQFIGLRFFTVYGPGQRPDLAIHKFARLMQEDRTIPIFGDGSMKRDYTFVEDTVDGIVGAMSYDKTRYEVVNLGNDRTVTLMELIRSLETVLGLRARIHFLAEQPGDVPQTWASIDKARSLLGYAPTTEFIDGLRRFATWLNQETEGRIARTATAADVKAAIG